MGSGQRPNADNIRRQNPLEACWLAEANRGTTCSIRSRARGVKAPQWWTLGVDRRHPEPPDTIGRRSWGWGDPDQWAYCKSEATQSTISLVWRPLWRRDRLPPSPNENPSLLEPEKSQWVSWHPSPWWVDSAMNRGSQAAIPEMTKANCCQSLRFPSIWGDFRMWIFEDFHNPNFQLLFRIKWPGITHPVLPGQNSCPFPQWSAFVPYLLVQCKRCSFGLVLRLTSSFPSQLQRGGLGVPHPIRFLPGNPKE